MESFFIFWGYHFWDHFGCNFECHFGYHSDVAFGAAQLSSLLNHYETAATLLFFRFPAAFFLRPCRPMSVFSWPAGIRTLSHLVQYWPRVSPVGWAPSLPQSTHETNNTPPYDLSRVSPALRSKNKKKKGRRQRKTTNDETCSQLVCLHVCNMAVYLLFLCPSVAHVG